MASSLTFYRSFTTIKPHVPLIQFRKGGLDGAHHSSAKSASQPAGQASRASSIKGTSGPTIEDFQLSLKYRRRPIDEVEIAAINNGGVI